MRERVETFRGSAWLEAAGDGTFHVFASEEAEEVLGVVAQDAGEPHYVWRPWGDEADLMTASGTKEAAVAAVLRSARERAG